MKSPPNGITDVAPACSTPGSVRIASRARARNARRAAGSGYLEAGMDSEAVATPSGSKPGSIDSFRLKLTSSSAAPIRSANASETCVTTSALRAPSVARPAVPVRPSCRNTVLRSAWNSRKTGIVPNSTPASSATAAVAASTGACTPISAARGRSSAPSAAIARVPAAPSARPSRPPPTASTTLSVSSWRAMRHRPAPSANRVASSRDRAVDRTSTRLAMFTHPISSTSRTPPWIRNSVPRISRVNSDR